MNNIELAAGLRALADFYETHPEMPLPGLPTFFVFAYDRSTFDIAKAQLGEECVQTLTDEKYPEVRLVRKFGGVELRFSVGAPVVGRRVMKNMPVESWELAPEAEAEAPAHNPLDCKDPECTTCNELAEAK
jgi:hypothetical protein